MHRLRPIAKTHVLPYVQLWKSRRDVYKTLQAALYFLLCSYCACLSNSYADRINPNNKLPFGKKYSAPDVLIDAMAPLSKRNDWVRKDISDVLLGITMTMIFSFCLTRKENCFTLLKRFLILSGTLYLLRAPMISLTVLPTPYHFCESSFDENIWYDGLVLLAQRRVSCGDVFFSGHTIMFTASILLFAYNSPRLIYTACVSLVATTGMISLMYTAYHYTIDVLVAIMLTFGVWVMYHWAAEIEELKPTPWGRVVAFWEETGPPGTGRWKLDVPVAELYGVPHATWRNTPISRPATSLARLSIESQMRFVDLEGGRAPLLQYASRFG